MNKISNYFKENYILLSILFVSAILRIYHVDFQSLWVDEINTIIQSTPHQSFKDTYLSLLNLDLQPPLYFYILKYLFRIFGYTTLVMRLFSAFLGIAGVYSIYLFGKELYNKKVGYYAALILCLNYYHIYFSQEGRPYAFLILFTTLSFYKLIHVIKQPSYKNAIQYGILAALILYGHPYGLFCLLAQYLILMYYFILFDNTQRLFFFKQGCVSVIVTFLLYIPALPLLSAASHVTSFWISLPEMNVFNSILKEFFGNSELILSIVYLMLILFFVKLFLEPEKDKNLTKPEENILINSYIILIPWIVIGIITPLIRSYLTVPMIIPRYLTILLPAVITIVAIGIYNIKHKIVQYSFLGLIVVFSLTDILIVKDFYNKRIKSDFRGISDYVIKHKKSDEPVVSRIGFHYSYFFNNCNQKIPVLWYPLDEYIPTLMTDPTKLRSFWFLDAQSVPIPMTKENQHFLDSIFYLESKKDLYDAVALHYVKKNKNFSTLSFPGNKIKAEELKINNDLSFQFNRNTSLSSDTLSLDTGNYRLLIGGESLPKLPVNNINAHFTILLNDKVIGGCFLNEKNSLSIQKIDFYVTKKKKYCIKLIFDNYISLKNQSRKAIINSVFIEKL